MWIMLLRMLFDPNKPSGIGRSTKTATAHSIGPIANKLYPHQSSVVVPYDQILETPRHANGLNVHVPTWKVCLKRRLQQIPNDGIIHLKAHHCKTQHIYFHPSLARRVIYLKIWYLRTVWFMLPSFFTQPLVHFVLVVVMVVRHEYLRLYTRGWFWSISI